MKKKINCWEYHKCGREPEGAKTDKSGVCPVAIHQEYDNQNAGENAGGVLNS